MASREPEFSKHFTQPIQHANERSILLITIATRLQTQQPIIHLYAQLLCTMVQQAAPT
jgi:hypothetical protein